MEQGVFRSEEEGDRMSKPVEEILEQLNEIAGDRLNHDSHCQEVADYMIPRKGTFTATRSPGSKIRTKIYEDTATYALDVLAAGIHGKLTSPATDWFKIKPQDEDLWEHHEVKEWFSKVQKKMYQVFRRSNFHTQMPEGYLDIGAFGQMNLAIEKDPQTIVRFKAQPVAECYIAENDRGMVDTLFRKPEFTVRQARQKWGEAALPKDIRKKLKDQKYSEKFTVIHGIFPREDFNPIRIDNKNLPFTSIYIEPESKKVLNESGYHEFPYACPRWYTASGEVNGRSPAMRALATVRVINAMEKTTLRAGQKNVDPPLLVPHECYVAPLNTSPGALLMKRLGIHPGEKIEPLLTGINLPSAFDQMDRKQKAIFRAFYVDLFLMLDQLTEERKQITATEILERVEEKMTLLGPALGRLMSECLDVVIHRVFNIMARGRDEKGNPHFPPPPEVLKEQQYEIEYIGPLARAQRLPELTAINRSLNLAIGMAEVMPQVLDKYNPDKIVDITNDILGVPPEIMNGEEEIKAIRDQRDEMKAAEAAMLMAQQGGEAARSLGQGMKEMEGMPMPAEEGAA